jgi:hypothetical protein
VAGSSPPQKRRATLQRVGFRVLATIVVHGGFDWASSVTIRKVKEAVVILASKYSIDISFDQVIIPIGEDEAGQLGLPEVVVVYNGRRRTVSQGRVPGTDEIVDAVFELMEEELGPLLPPLRLGDEKAEEGLLSV